MSSQQGLDDHCPKCLLLLCQVAYGFYRGLLQYKEKKIEGKEGEEGKPKRLPKTNRNPSSLPLIFNYNL